MPSPDATPYVDLTVYDKDEQDLYEDAELRLSTALPTWVPREGNTEVLLMETLAAQVAEGVYTINRLPSGIMEALLLLFGVERDNGSPPVATLTFTMVNTLGYTIAAGTEARLDLPGGLESIVFTTMTDLVIAPGNSSGTVSATGDRFTDDANNIATNTALELLDSVIYVNSVVLTAITTGGSEPEDDDAYFTRGATRFSRLSDTLVLPRHFTAYALENASVVRATTLDNWDGSGGAPGDDPGHVTVAVYGNGTTLSGPVKAALQTEMENLALTNLVVHVIDPTVTTVNVTATVRALPGYTQAEVQASVVAALNAYLDPGAWEWGTTVYRNELITLISNVEGVDRTESLTTPASDTALSGYATLVDAGTITITVNLP
jgi:uncharacterized phage protein gp47/JayE